MLWKYHARLVQLVPLRWRQVRNFSLHALGQGHHSCHEEEYSDYGILYIYFSYFSKEIYIMVTDYSRKKSHLPVWNPAPCHTYITKIYQFMCFISVEFVNTFFYKVYTKCFGLKGYSAEADPLVPILKLSIYLTVDPSSGTVVPPDWNKIYTTFSHVKTHRTFALKGAFKGTGYTWWTFCNFCQGRQLLWHPICNTATKSLLEMGLLYMVNKHDKRSCGDIYQSILDY